MKNEYKPGGYVSLPREIDVNYIDGEFIAKKPVHVIVKRRVIHQRDTKGKRLAKKKKRKLNVSFWIKLDAQKFIDYIDSIRYANFSRAEVLPLPFFDVVPKTIAVIGGSIYDYNKYVFSFPEFLHPAFIRVNNSFECRGLHFTDIKILSDDLTNINSIFNLIYSQLRAIHPKNIYKYNNLKFILK